MKDRAWVKEDACAHRTLTFRHQLDDFYEALVTLHLCAQSMPRRSAMLMRVTPRLVHVALLCLPTHAAMHVA